MERAMGIEYDSLSYIACIFNRLPEVVNRFVDTNADQKALARVGIHV